MNFELSAVPEFYQGYVREYDFSQGANNYLCHSLERLQSLGENISEEKSVFRYAVGKWSIKDVFQHLIDSERVFSYRMLRFARNDKTYLPGFEQDDYVMSANANQRTLATILTEFKLLRQSTIMLYESLTSQQLSHAGRANGYIFSTEMQAFITAGHCDHHSTILQKRYLS